MPTVNDAVEAGAKALAAEGGGPGDSIHSWRCEYPDRYPGACECVPGVTMEVLRAAWPVLSAGLRELADEWVKRNPDRWHRFGAQRGIEASREVHAEELLRELDRIDKELGND